MLSLLGWVWRGGRAGLEWAGLVAAQEGVASPGQARVVVRLQGRSTELQLDPAWTVRDVKQLLVARLGPGPALRPDMLRIILAGRELGDEVGVASLDLGHQSILHAVTVQLAPAPASPAPAPLSETLVDLQLTGAERLAEARVATFYCW